MRIRRIITATALFACFLFIIGITTIGRSNQLFDRRQRSSGLVNDDAKKANKTYFKYPPRVDMGKCPPLYGKVAVLVIMVQESYDTHYKVAQETLKCYLKTVDYKFILVDLDSDQRVKNECHHNQLFFKKHCAVAAYLNESDWTLVLDADTGVVNPNHCIEEWIDPRVDIIFYERFFNWEIASGNYLVKNTPFARNFLIQWAEWQYSQPKNWNGADNGVLHMHILQTIIPDAKQEIKNCDNIWHRATGYDTYMAFVTCVRQALGAERFWPRKLRFLRKAHGWVRDGFITGDKFCERDFMMHGWKLQAIGESGWQSPFQAVPDVNKCGNGYEGWSWRNTSKISIEEIRENLASFENSSAKAYPKDARVIPYIFEPGVGDCYPNCDDSLNIQNYYSS